MSLSDLEKTLGIAFKNHALLQQALYHRSYVNENLAAGISSNERLEFLGDAVLGFVVASELFNLSPNLSEGEMTKLRAALVSQKSLAALALSLKLGDFLCLGRGEDEGGGRNRPSNLASAFEAVLGAVFVDQGLEPAREFVLRLLAKELHTAVSGKEEADYKSRLQELVQSAGQQVPEYRVVEVAGPDHDRTFTVEVLVAGELKGTGKGRSKKEAETEAARHALESLS